MNTTQLEYVPGTWVFYNNPNHHYHGMMFQVSQIIPMRGLDNARDHKGFWLTYGGRSIEASHSELVKRGTPAAKPFETGEYQINNAPNFLKQGEAAKHDGHVIVENYAGGEPFKYCRDCKEEVFNGTSKNQK